MCVCVHGAEQLQHLGKLGRRGIAHLRSCGMCVCVCVSVCSVCSVYLCVVFVCVCAVCAHVLAYLCAHARLYLGADVLTRACTLKVQ
jgi:hypothetical protein